jgi:hypothetical protein
MQRNAQTQNGRPHGAPVQSSQGRIRMSVGIIPTRRCSELDRRIDIRRDIAEVDRVGPEDAQRRDRRRKAHARHGGIFVVPGREIFLRLVDARYSRNAIAFSRFGAFAATPPPEMFMCAPMSFWFGKTQPMFARSSARRHLVVACAARGRSSRCSTSRCRTRPRRCRAAGRCRRPADRGRSSRRRRSPSPARPPAPRCAISAAVMFWV